MCIPLRKAPVTVSKGNEPGDWRDNGNRGGSGLQVQKELGLVPTHIRVFLSTQHHKK